MFLYCCMEEKNFISVMCSKYIDLEKYYLYKRMPKINDNYVNIKLEILKNEEKFLSKIDSYKYMTNRTINLEGRKWNVLVFDNNQLGRIKKSLFIFKEVKVNKIEELPIYIIRNDGKVNYNKKEENKNLLMYEYKEKCNNKLDKIKGFVYGTIIEETYLNEFLLNKIIDGYNELCLINNIVDELKNDNLMNRKFSSLCQSFKNEILKVMENNFNKKNDGNIIIKINERKEIEINKDLFSISNNEAYLYEYIINYLIDEDKNINENEIILKFIKNIRNFITVNKLNCFNQDMYLIENRVKNNDFTVKFTDIKSILFQNIYVFCIKFNNLSEYYSFIYENGIEKSYLAFGLYGALKGYTYMPKSMLSNIDRKEIFLKIIIETLRYCEDSLFNNQYNVIYIKNRLNYFLYKLIPYLKDLNNINYKYADIYYKDRKLIICNKDNNKIIINYNIRKKSLAKSIEYFDCKMRRVSNAFNNFEYVYDYYFNYYFILRGKVKSLDINLEEYFSIILRDIYLNVIKKEKNMNEH